MSLVAEVAPAAVQPASSTAAAVAATAEEKEAEETHELTTALLHTALGDLRHNRDGELAYTLCNLAAKRLSSLPGLEHYSNLQQLILDNNALTELTAVRHMPQLVYLSARHNKLTSDVLDSLAGAAGCLERLHLDDNCLTNLDGLESLPYLTDLTCSGNKVERVTARCLSAAQRLMRLRLDHNCIVTIETNAFDVARHLRVLELEHNAIANVDFLRSVSAQLERLVLAGNRISHLGDGLEQLTRLTVLDVRHNALHGLEELLALRTLSALRILFFDGNDRLVHLPLAVKTPPGMEGEAAAAQLLPAAGRTEYHAEVVMSDEEGEGRPEHERRGSGMAASTYTDERSRTAHPVHIASSGGDEEEYDTPRSVGCKSAGDSRASPRPHSVTSATATAPPTTAAYVVLASPETYDFIRTVGSVARDAALSVRVDPAKEIAALPQEEQVYLWTLSVLPHLLEVNGRSIRPADVARANFLFSPKC